MYDIREEVFLEMARLERECVQRIAAKLAARNEGQAFADIEESKVTHAERRAFEFIAMLAANAHADLSTKAGDGPKARPTVAQLNRTLDRLASIRESVETILHPAEG